MKPQVLDSDAEALGSNPLEGLVQIDEIDAQRGFSDVGSGAQKPGEPEAAGARLPTGKLSGQLSRYYERHLDPSDVPDPDDMEAMEGIAKAQQSFDERLDKGFEKALRELEQLGYPGLTDPRLSVKTKIEPLHAMRHASAVQYDVIASDESGTAAARLPEQSSGLGYQNLISIVFRLIGFRDGWMRTGKAARRVGVGNERDEKPHPPLHLVLVEEPEAHLHAQVQQVFIRKAYAVLRNHEDLGEKNVSGHSKSASDGRIKTGHFEVGLAHRAAAVAQVRDEPTQREPATFHFYTVGQRLVGTQDRPRTRHPPRDGGQVSAHG